VGTKSSNPLPASSYPSLFELPKAEIITESSSESIWAQWEFWDRMEVSTIEISSNLLKETK
jgi:hypothetical protein